MQTTDRALALLCISIAAMGGLGAAAMLVDLIETGEIASMAIFFVPVAFMLGCLVGLPSTFFVVFCLMKKRLMVSVPFVYLPSLGVVVAHASMHHMWQDAPITALLALASVCILSVAGKFVLPNAPPASGVPGRCVACGYSRTGLPPDRVCPECGTAA